MTTNPYQLNDTFFIFVMIESSGRFEFTMHIIRVTTLSPSSSDDNVVKQIRLAMELSSK